MHIFLSIVWDVNPIIAKIGWFELRYYGPLFASGFLISYFIVQHFFKKENIPLEELDRLTTYTIVGAVVGARLGHILFYEPQSYIENPLEILKVWHGGLASHGGTIGVILALWLYSRKSKRDFIWVMDRVAIPTALTSALIRVGNLMNSEIYGGPTDKPWGFIFTYGREFEGQACHPTQIYEALSYLILFFILFYLYKKHYSNPLPAGRLVGIFLMGTFGMRFLIEFLKNTQVDFEKNMFLNMGQLLSIPFILLGVYFAFFYKKQKA